MGMEVKCQHDNKKTALELGYTELGKVAIVLGFIIDGPLTLVKHIY